MLFFLHHIESISCLCLILLSVLIIYDVTLTEVIMSELHHFTSWFNLVLCLLLFYIFVIHNSVQMTFHISICSCHEQLSTNDYPYHYRFFPCTYLYKWIFYYHHGLSILNGEFLCVFGYNFLFHHLCDAH